MRWSALLLATCTFACRGHERHDPAPAAAAGSGGSAALASPVHASVPTPAPRLPALDAAVAEPTAPGEKFAAEHVDETWKSREEAELRGKLAHIHGGPPQLECRSTTCLVTVTASEADLRAAITDLGQLHDLARSMVLTAPEKQADGRLALRAYVQFDRSPAGDDE